MRRRPLRATAAAWGSAARSQVFFLAARTQQVTKRVVARVPVTDVLTAVATGGAVLLWGLTLYLIGG